ncbi:MAG TPA: DUF4129 domain-containing protein [Panacibacter sp.]|nr:DUF4129 domain-containing protein [Panacibacter sp.]HNP43483.1 DUF4129 domain-containing protein [Panacibacter sp.]
MRFTLLILLSFFSFAAVAKQKPAFDSAAVNLRSFNINAIDSFKVQRDFQYQAEPVEQQSLWDRFWNWIWDLYDEIMSTESGRTTMNIIYILLALFAIGFFVFRVMRMNRVAMFATNVANTHYSIEEENIHSISFEEAIKDATLNGNYRLAIRLLYLQNLKLLADKNLIAWLPGKTNADYKNELKDTVFGEAFSDITSLFDMAWYGHREIGKGDFDNIGGTFTHFKSQLS